MAASPSKKIFAKCDRTEFAARENELAALLAHVDESNDGGTLLLSSEPGAGATELLAVVADELFSRRDKVAPFYFRFAEGETAMDAARRFAYEFVLQTVAFLRRQPSLFSTAPSFTELQAIATPRDSVWIDELHRAARINADPDDGSLQRVCISAPFRAAAAGIASVVIVDDFHLASELEANFASLVERSSVPVIVSGYRRHQFGKLTGKRKHLDRPNFHQAGKIVGALARRRNVTIKDECRDLIAAQSGGNIALADAWILDAADQGCSLASFQRVEQAYAESLFGGRLGRRFDDVLSLVSDSHEVRRRIIGLIADSGPADDGGIPIELWERRLDTDAKQVRRMIERLNINELIDIDSNCIQLNANNVIFGDYLAKRSKLEFDGSNRAIVFGKALGSFIRRAPVLMGDIYRREASIGLRSLLASFDGTEVPESLVDYDVFKRDLKGEPDAVAAGKIANATAFVRLPKMFFAGDAAALHRSLSEIAVDKLTAFAMGFDDVSVGGDDTVWIAAEIESKLEAPKDVAEYWCDQLELAALKCETSTFRLWLIAPEGFTEEAMELLRRRNAFGSSRRQVELLRQYLSADRVTPSAASGEEYEFVLPMDQDAELIAARAIEDIAKRHNVETKTVNQIKTALIEAYINASEHSLSPDRKIHQQIRVENDKIEITISNRGVRLESVKAKVVEFDQGRRGWGLKLMRQLMDDVRIEAVDDGTRITMTKYLKFNVPAVASN